MSTLTYRVACQSQQQHHAGRPVQHLRLTARGRAVRDVLLSSGFIAALLAGLSLAAHLVGPS